MKVEEIICDQCGARKGKENHWYGLNVGDLTFMISKDPNIMSGGMKDICGENCAMKALQEFLDPPKKEKQWITNEEVDEMIFPIEEQLPQ